MPAANVDHRLSRFGVAGQLLVQLCGEREGREGRGERARKLSLEKKR
jgi:hypothetical protein